MDRVPKVARPPTAARVGVAQGVPAEGLVRRATGMLDVSLVTRLLNWSSTCTVSAGLMAAPATVVLGCTPKPRWSAAAAVMLKKAEVPPPRLASPAVNV